MIYDVDAIGLLLLLALALAFVACGAIGGYHERRVVFTTPLTVPGPGMCGCGAPKCTPPEAPFPGDVPVLAAPVQAPAPHPADDSEWTKGAVRDVWALLDAEAKP